MYRPRIENTLRGFHDLHAIMFEPNGAPIVTKSKDAPKMSTGRASLVALIDRYLGGQMDPLVTLLEVRKLMYFMQEAGVRLPGQSSIAAPTAIQRWLAAGGMVSAKLAGVQYSK
jgi:hypothetical protein